MNSSKPALSRKPHRSKDGEGNNPGKSREGKAQQHVFVQIVVAKDEGAFHAYAPALKGLHVDGTTQDEAIENVKEAIAVYLESLRKHGDPLPESPGLVIQRANLPNGAFLQSVTMQWPSLSPSGIS